MILLTDEIRQRLPPLYATEHQDDPVVQVKFFTPDAQWTWYATEFDSEDLCFGSVVGMETELGYFSLNELGTVRGRFGLPVERDLSFRPMPLSQLRRLHERERVMPW